MYSYAYTESPKDRWLSNQRPDGNNAVGPRGINYTMYDCLHGNNGDALSNVIVIF